VLNCFFGPFLCLFSNSYLFYPSFLFSLSLSFNPFFLTISLPNYFFIFVPSAFFIFDIFFFQQLFTLNTNHTHTQIKTFFIWNYFLSLSLSLRYRFHLSLSLSLSHSLFLLPQINILTFFSFSQHNVASISLYFSKERHLEFGRCLLFSAWNWAS
jgi:hypothetical protein